MIHDSLSRFVIFYDLLFMNIMMIVVMKMSNSGRNRDDLELELVINITPTRNFTKPRHKWDKNCDNTMVAFNIKIIKFLCS